MSVEKIAADTGSAGLTAAEQAYFDSRGATTEGLGIEPEAPAPVVSEAPKPDPKPAVADPAKPDAAKPDPAKPDVLDPDEEPLGDDGRPRNPGRFIRFGAFDKERQARRALEADLKAEREARSKEQVERARVAERLDLLNQALTAPATTDPAKAEPAEPPDPEKDIFGYVRWQDQRMAEMQKRFEETAKQGQERHQQTAAQLQEAGIRGAYVNDAQRFATTNPDFGAAYQHLLQSRDQELAHVGVSDPKRRAALIAAEERDIVEGALRDGVSPAQRIYGLAKLRGHVVPAAPAPTEATPPTPTAAVNNGTATNGAVAPSVSDEIARIKAGADASKSLSTAGSSPSGLTVEALASMPQDEFDAWLAKASKAQVKAVMGG